MEEEAIEEELWQAVMNLAAGEEHEMETLIRLVNAVVAKEATEEELKKHLLKLALLRDKRKRLVNLILEARGTSVDFVDSQFRSYKGETWCLIKHLLITKMHLFETAQKYLTLYEKTEEENFLQRAAECFVHAREINDLIMDCIEDLFPRKSD